MTHRISRRLSTAALLAALGVLHGARPTRAQGGHAPPSRSVQAIFEALADPRNEKVKESLFLALERLPIQDVRSHLARRSQESISDGERAVSIEVLGRCGQAVDLDAMVALATGAKALGGEDRVPASLERAVGRLLEREQAAYANVGSLLPRAREELRGPLFDAVDRRGTDAGLRLLVRVAEERTSLAPLALAHLAKAGSRTARPVDEGVLSSVRAVLAVSGSPVLPEAVLAAGCLDDYRAIPRLIELVDDPRPGVRRNAQWALGTLSGLELLGGSDRWKSWYRAEEAWRREELPQLERDLASGDRGMIALALEEIAGKRCFRHDLARTVARLLDERDPEVVALACDTLRHLGSKAVLEPLNTCLTHAAPAVRAAAQSALASIRGEEPRSGRAARKPARRRDPRPA